MRKRKEDFDHGSPGLSFRSDIPLLFFAGIWRDDFFPFRMRSCQSPLSPEPYMQYHGSDKYHSMASSLVTLHSGTNSDAAQPVFRRDPLDA